MKTQWMVAGVVVLALGAAAPWGVGYYTEHQWQSVAAGINDSQTAFRVETRDYDRGYMNASIRGSVTVVMPETGEQQSFDYQARVSHGITGSLMDFSTPEDLSAEVKKYFPDERPRLTLETRIWGAGIVELTIPEVNVTDEQTGETMVFSRAYGRADIGSAGTTADIILEWPGMTVTGPDADFSVSDLKMEQSVEHLTGELWLGDVDMSLASLQISAPQQPKVAFSGLSIISTSDATENGARLNADASFKLDEVQANGEVFGPHEIQMRLDGLDVASMEALSAAMNDMQHAALNMPADAGPQAQMQQQMAMVQKISEAFSSLASEGFTFGFPKIDLSTPEGPVTGEIQLSHPELSDEEKQQTLLVMQGLTGNLDLSMPAALVDNNPGLAMQVAPLIQQGMVVQEGDRLHMVGTLEDMALTINGNVIPLPPIF
ncbi:DUF945 family protein [Marinobacter sp. CHS3-4]|uniref:DUF945 family protein n=1 Tax=Marinobacter sp. CHS3-4 TaxID=3045174 RepID=UPI0024B4B476|nr:DUF945 family protein [Marinobacter sp. CHS3-4]MDI9244108.1 DUF945 family protein [Marinobacter sp. CHS3-4]